VSCSFEGAGLLDNSLRFFRREFVSSGPTPSVVVPVAYYDQTASVEFLSDTGLDTGDAYTQPLHVRPILRCFHLRSCRLRCGEREYDSGRDARTRCDADADTDTKYCSGNGGATDHGHAARRKRDSGRHSDAPARCHAHAAGYAPTLMLPLPQTATNAQLTLVVSNVAPAAAPPLALARFAQAFRGTAALPTGATVLLYNQIYSTATLTLPTAPGFTFVIPPADVIAGANYNLALFDPDAPELAFGNTASRAGNGNRQHAHLCGESRAVYPRRKSHLLFRTVRNSAERIANRRLRPPLLRRAFQAKYRPRLRRPQALHRPLHRPPRRARRPHHRRHHPEQFGFDFDHRADAGPRHMLAAGRGRRRRSDRAGELQRGRVTAARFSWRLRIPRSRS